MFFDRINPATQVKKSFTLVFHRNMKSGYFYPHYFGQMLMWSVGLLRLYSDSLNNCATIVESLLVILLSFFVALKTY